MNAGAHGLAEVFARVRAGAGTSTPRASMPAMVSSQASAGTCRAMCGKPVRGAHLLDRAEVHLGGAELEPRALGAGAEVGAGQHRRSPRTSR